MVSAASYPLLVPDEPGEVPRELRAGPVTAELHGADLRRVRLGRVELVQRVYVAVRDEVWNTIPARVANLRVDASPDRFSVSFEAHHLYEAIDFRWTGSIVGAPDGRITYAMDGVAGQPFRYAKIGFNVHHASGSCVGRRYTARTPGGDSSDVFPVEIDPQRVVNGRLTALSPPFDRLAIELDDGLEVQLGFEGDLFELQDHRNWTDGNYKSYGTPIAEPWPFDAATGQRLQQRVSMFFAAAELPAAPREELGVELGRPLGLPLPPLGLCVASDGAALSERERRLLSVLGPDHVRADLAPGEPSFSDELRSAVETSEALSAPLELALFLGEEAEVELTTVADALGSLDARLARVLVLAAESGFTVVSGCTPGGLVRLARERLRPLTGDVPFAGGTDRFFAELNRDRPEVEAMDAVVYSINPQVHAADSLSLVENLEAQADTVRTARSFSGDLPILVGTVTLAARAGPYPAGPPEPGALPPRVDVRQASLLAAGWTLGSVEHLAESGVSAATYYETTGWLGVVERDEGPPRPELFPSRPGDVYPLYHVFADLADCKRGDLVDARSSDPLAVEALAVRSGEALRVLLANLTPRRRSVSLAGLPAGRVRVRVLDEETGALAVADPERFRSSGREVEAPDGTLVLDLGRYAVARVDAGP